MLFRGHKTALTFDDSYTEVMAFQHAMQAGYTSFEVGLRRAFAMIGEALPQRPDWHAVLLRRAASALENGRPP